VKIGIFDPYLDTLGGGEKYILTIASCLEKNNHTVFLFWDDNTILTKAQRRFGSNVQKIHCVKNIFSPNISMIERLLETKKYDMIFFVSDGSIPLVLSQKLFIIFQYPIKSMRTNSLSDKIKIARIQNIFCYSEFVKKNLDPVLAKKSIVLSPPVENISAGNTKKENIVLTVGRFTRAVNMKKQEELIKIFRMLCDQGLSNWQFIIAGSSLSADNDFVEKLKLDEKGYPIVIYHNPSHDELISCYKKAKIYWHGAGYGEDLITHPERAEHFGITTVEAMSAGAVPLAFAGGGQVEIIDNGKNGFLWDTKENLMKKTMELIKNEKLWKTLSLQAEERAKIFNEERFCQKLMEIIQ